MANTPHVTTAPSLLEAESKTTPNRLEVLGVALLLLVIGALYFAGLSRNVPALTSPTPNGYYGLLTEAFNEGQLHVKLEPDPRLLALADPYAGPQGVPRPHDMSFYKQKFYPYFGATPVFILYWPWLLLTGTYLAEMAVTVAMLYGGFVLSAVWLVSIKRRYFPGLASGWLFLVVAVLGLAPPLLTESLNPTFYAVPIAGAFFCVMVGFLALDQALARANGAAQTAWVALASFAWGMSVGARPIYVLGLPVLAASVAWLWWQLGAATRFRREAAWLWLAAIIPAAAVGVWIGIYNYLRFDDPLDFGIQYALAGSSQLGMKMVSTQFIGKNLELYLLHPAELIRYFPFLHTNLRPWGVVRYLPFITLAALLPLTWFSPSLRERRWVLGTLTLLGVTVANFFLLSLFFGGEERYLVDFAPTALLASAAVLLAILDTASWWRSTLAKAVPYTLALTLSAAAIGLGAVFAINRAAPSPLLTAARRAFNQPAHLMERVSGTVQGPLELTVRFPTNRIGQIEPLLTTGVLSATGDIVYVKYPDANHVQFGFFHLGAGGPMSEPVPVDYSQPHTVRITMGALYPPADHPAYRNWSELQVDRVRRHLEVSLDGRPVLRGAASVYVSTPDRVFVGQNPLAGDVSKPLFTGQILTKTRLGLQAGAPVGVGSGPVKLKVRFPATVTNAGLPLVATGETGKGDVVFATLDAAGRLQFGHDHWGGSVLATAPQAIDLSVDHEVGIEMGSLYPPGADAGGRGERLRIELDGQVLVDCKRQFHPSDAALVEFGYNAIESSAVETMFTGSIRSVERVPPAPSQAQTGWGSLKLSLTFPPFIAPRAEPLLVTGHAGRADIIYVRYVDPTHIRIGMDHWSVGGAESDLIEISPGWVCTLEIEMASLYPPKVEASGHPGDAATGEVKTEVFFNGASVFKPPFVSYPAVPGELYIGSNELGASSCDTQFTGTILSVERGGTR